MAHSFEEHREEIIGQALEKWKESEELKDIELDPVIKLLFSALSSQSYTITQQMDEFRQQVVNEFRDSTLPYHLIKPFPAFSLLQTGIKGDNNTVENSLDCFIAGEDTYFEFGKSKTRFTPLLETKIIQAQLTDNAVNAEEQEITYTLSSPLFIEDYAGLSLYVEHADRELDITVRIDGQEVPVVSPAAYESLPFNSLFHKHRLLTDQNQLPFGAYEYWAAFQARHQAQLFYIGSYDTRLIRAKSKSPVLSIICKNPMSGEQLKKLHVRINCVPVVNIQKSHITLSPQEPVKSLSSGDTYFLSLLQDENGHPDTSPFLIRHYGIERYNREELLWQLNALYNRFISDYYAFKDIDELKKGDKMDNLYKAFKEILPVVKLNRSNKPFENYAVLKLDKRLQPPNDKVGIHYLSTNCEQANGIKAGEKPVSLSEFLHRDNTFLLKDTTGGKTEEKNEETLNHLSRYSILTRGTLVTKADIKAFCYKELRSKVQDVTINHQDGVTQVDIRLNKEAVPEKEEKEYEERRMANNILQSGIVGLRVKVTIHG